MRKCSVYETKGPVSTARGNSLCASPSVERVGQAGAMKRAPTSLRANIHLRPCQPLVRNAGLMRARPAFAKPRAAALLHSGPQFPVPFDKRPE